MNIDTFVSCFDQATYKERIQTEQIFASSNDVRGSPTFLVIKGGKIVHTIQGALPFNEFETALNSAIKSRASGTRFDTSILGDARFLGDADAKVLLIEFGGFEEQFSKRFASNTLPQIKSEFIDTGKIQFVFFDFLLDHHLNAESATLATWCANEQGKFWEYHDRILDI